MELYRYSKQLKGISITRNPGFEVGSKYHKWLDFACVGAIIRDLLVEDRLLIIISL